MTAASVARHTINDLHFLGIDPDGWVAFEADSASRPGHTHTILFDRITKYAECSGTTKACRNRTCWHCDERLLTDALIAETARQYVARAATLADVEAIGRQAKARIEACGEMWALVNPLDTAMLDAARREWKKRAAAGEMPAPATIVPALERAGLVERMAVAA